MRGPACSECDACSYQRVYTQPTVESADVEGPQIGNALDPRDLVPHSDAAAQHAQLQPAPRFHTGLLFEPRKIPFC